jgi:hypothetical protein
MANSKCLGIDRGADPNLLSVFYYLLLPLLDRDELPSDRVPNILA